MNFSPILQAPLAIQLHLITIVVALIATAIILPMKKGTPLHRTTGWVWATSMMATAVITFWITTIDVFWGLSPIHIFSVIVLFNVPYAIVSARRGDIVAHKNAMMGVTVGGLGVAGLFTLLPGRIMHEVLF